MPTKTNNKSETIKELLGKIEIGVKEVFETGKYTEYLKQLIFYYYIVYWNNRRICSTIGGMPPVVKQGAYYEMLADQTA